MRSRYRLPRWQVCIGVAAVLLLAGQVCQAAVVASDGKATHEGLLQLTSGNWSTEIQKGAWLVEFFSPYCRHCKKFLPTWQELVTNKEFLRSSYPDAPFTLAQVNCYAQQDICVQEKVPHIPRLSIYKDGVLQAGEYQGNREYTDLSNYVEKEAAAYRKSKGVSDEPHPLSTTDASTAAEQKKLEVIAPAPDKDKSTDAKTAMPGAEPAVAPTADPVDTASIEPAKASDDKAALAPPPPPQDAPAPASPPTPSPEPAPVTVPGPNPNGIVLRFGKDEAVKDETALKTMLSKTGGSGSTFIKFFASWCPHCKAMASAYIQIGDALRGRMNVVEVDCEQHHAICQHYDVRSYPTLRMYNEGEATEYRGGRSFEAMRSWAINAGSASGVREITANELDGLRRSDEVLFLYLHSPQTPQREIDAVTKASRVLLTTPVHVYRSTDDQLITKYRTRLVQGSASSHLAIDSYSGLLVFKDHDIEQPTSAYYPSQLTPSLSDQEATKQVATWLEKERYATVAEVTGSTFTDIIHNKQDAPVVLAALSDIHHSGRTQSTGSGSQLRDVELQYVKSLALAWRQRNHQQQESQDAKHDTIRRQKKVLFAWIDADRWASAIKKYYKIKAENVPRLVLADGARLEYYDLPSKFIDPFSTKKQAWIDNKEVIDTLDLIWLGKGPKAKSSRSYLDRGVRRTGAAAMSAARHPILAFFAGSTLIFVLIQVLKRQAVKMNHTATRLPYNTKGD